MRVKSEETGLSFEIPAQSQGLGTKMDRASSSFILLY